MESAEPENRDCQELENKAATIIKTKTPLLLLADEPDNRVLECALEAEADFIVTGDRHLLSLKHFQNIKILSLSNFLETLSEDLD